MWDFGWRECSPIRGCTIKCAPSSFGLGAKSPRVWSPREREIFSLRMSESAEELTSKLALQSTSTNIRKTQGATFTKRHASRGRRHCRLFEKNRQTDPFTAGQTHSHTEEDTFVYSCHQTLHAKTWGKHTYVHQRRSTDIVPKILCILASAVDILGPDAAVPGRENTSSGCKGEGERHNFFH